MRARCLEITDHTEGARLVWAGRNIEIKDAAAWEQENQQPGKQHIELPLRLAGAWQRLV
jgi:hypothetical protein